MSDVLRLARDGDVAVIEIDRPDKKNALPGGAIATLGDMLASDEVLGARCLVVRGAGEVFCSGMDLADLGKSGSTYDSLAHYIGPVLVTLRELPVPTISSVAGPALGFGFGLAMCCDITIAAEDAMFGNPFRRIGAVLDSGGHYFLRQRVGHHRAAELIYTGRMLDGREAAAMGLINEAVPASELAERTMALARLIAEGPTLANKASKAILLGAHGFADVLEQEARAQDDAMKTADAKEGLASFMEKRQPRFSGK